MAKQGVWLAAAFWVLQLVSPVGNAYGRYDLLRIIDSSHEKSVIDLVYLDTMLDDMAQGSLRYPAEFSSDEETERATNDILALVNIADHLQKRRYLGNGLLLRMGLIYSMAFNLNVPETGDKALQTLQLFLDREPKHAYGNYLLGTYHASTAYGHDKALIPLELALRGGIHQAAYAMGLSYLALGDALLAIRYLEIYQEANPSDLSVAHTIQAIRNREVHVVRDIASGDQPR